MKIKALSLVVPFAVAIIPIHFHELWASQYEPGCSIAEDYRQPKLMNGKLSAFWGYDFVGVDLARETLKTTILQSGWPVRIATWEPVNLADLSPSTLSSELQTSRQEQIADQYRLKNNHGTLVAGIIAGQAPIGIALKPLFVAVGDEKTFDPNFEEESLKEAYLKKAQIFQVSTTSTSAAVFSFFQKVGIITVRPAGNYFPETRQLNANPSTSIIVGQLSPIGWMTQSSSPFPDVTITAPGEVYSRFEGRVSLFGGTSGAQPVVTGCLSNVVSLLPDLTPSEAKALMIKTAIPTYNSRVSPRLNGMGTLNCLKLAEVAKRLRIGWPQSRTDIVQDALYRFPTEARAAIAAANSALSDKTACGTRKSLDLLRRAFLLNPEDLNVRLKIAALYRQWGLPGNALLYESMQGFTEESTKRIAAETAGSKFEADVIRLVGELGGSQSILVSGLSSNQDTAVLLSAHFLSQSKKDVQPIKTALLRVFAKGNLGSFDSRLFFRSYLDALNFPAQDLLGICEREMPQWANIRDFPGFTACVQAMNRAPAAAMGVLNRQLHFGAQELRARLLTNWIKQKPAPQILEFLRNDRGIPWTREQRDSVEYLTRNSSFY